MIRFEVERLTGYRKKEKYFSYFGTGYMHAFY